MCNVNVRKNKSIVNSENKRLLNLNMSILR